MWVIINIVWVTFVLCSIVFQAVYNSFKDDYIGLLGIIILSGIVSTIVILGWLCISTFFISDSQLMGSSKVVSTRQLSKFPDTNQYLMYSKNHEYVFLQDNKVKKIKLSKINFKNGKQARLITKKYSYKVNQKSISWYQKYIFYGDFLLCVSAHNNASYHYILELPK